MPHQGLNWIGARYIAYRHDDDGFTWIEPFASTLGRDELRFVDGRDAIFGRSAGEYFIKDGQRLADIGIRPLEDIGHLRIAEPYAGRQSDRSHPGRRGGCAGRSKERQDLSIS